MVWQGYHQVITLFLCGMKREMGGLCGTLPRLFTIGVYLSNERVGDCNVEVPGKEACAGEEL